VVVVLSFSILGTQLLPSLVFARVTPQNLLIVITWFAGLWILKRAKNGLPWQAKGTAPGAQDKPGGHAESEKDANSKQKGESTSKVVSKFVVASVATLIAGYTLEQAGDHIASHIGMSGVLFGATVLAASTSLPELSTGITSVRMQDYQLAMSDIFGGNAFLPVLFLLASVISGTAVLPHAHKSDVYLATLGIVVTAVYMFGLIMRPARRVARMGADSLLVLVLYAIGMCGLLFVPQK
jgi:cation:H+ antiporter